VEPEDVDFKEWQNLNWAWISGDGQHPIENNYLVVQCRVRHQDPGAGVGKSSGPSRYACIAHRIADHIVALLSANASKGIASSQIVFERKTRTGKEIYLMDYDGAGEQPLTSNGSINVTPVWNNGNDSICFTSYYEGTPRLYFVSLASGQIQPFPVKGGLMTTPAFAPNGKELAFSGRLENSSDTDIYIAGQDGGGLRNLTQNPGIDISPCWNPPATSWPSCKPQGIPRCYLRCLRR
jgi:TolB protein